MKTVTQTKNRVSSSVILLLLALFAIGLARPTLAAEDDSNYSDAEVAQLMSPIALYPDTLLTHVLIAASYPLEVVQAQRWRAKHSSWSNDQLESEGSKQGWDPSVVALLAFPDVLDKMSNDLDWTEKVGEAFVANEAQVMDSIQNLRKAAYDAGNLKDVKNIKVEEDQQRIVIVSASPTVVYVPYYDTRYIYGDWYWGAYPPVYWDPFPGYVIAPHSLFYWSNNGIRISFNFFFGGLFWHDRTVWVDYRHRHTRYVHPRRSHNFEGQRWAHRPEHRRGVHYRSTSLNKRYEPKMHNNRDTRNYDRVYNSMSKHHLPNAKHVDGRNPQTTNDRRDMNNVQRGKESRNDAKQSSKGNTHSQPKASSQHRDTPKSNLNHAKQADTRMTTPGFKSHQPKTEQVRTPKQTERSTTRQVNSVKNTQPKQAQRTASKPVHHQANRSSKQVEYKSQSSTRSNNSGNHRRKEN